jgi:hypothetical protein
MIDSGAPSTAVLLGGWWWLLEPIAIVAAIFLVGPWVFNRSAENL